MQRKNGPIKNGEKIETLKPDVNHDTRSKRIFVFVMFTQPSMTWKRH